MHQTLCLAASDFCAVQSVREVMRTKKERNKRGKTPNRGGVWCVSANTKLHCWVGEHWQNSVRALCVRGGRQFFLPNVGAKWNAVLTEAGSTCGETDFMLFEVWACPGLPLPSSLALPLSFSLSPYLCLYFLTLSVCLLFRCHLFVFIFLYACLSLFVSISSISSISKYFLTIELQIKFIMITTLVFHLVGLQLTLVFSSDD